MPAEKHDQGTQTHLGPILALERLVGVRLSRSSATSLRRCPYLRQPTWCSRPCSRSTTCRPSALIDGYWLIAAGQRRPAPAHHGRSRQVTRVTTEILGHAACFRADSFMAKVPKVPGENHAPQFLGTQNYGNNNTRSIYNLPKREACLMAIFSIAERFSLGGNVRTPKTEKPFLLRALQPKRRSSCPYFCAGICAARSMSRLQPLAEVSTPRSTPQQGIRSALSRRVTHCHGMSHGGCRPFAYPIAIVLSEASRMGGTTSYPCLALPHHSQRSQP